jgi:uncharacterized protein YndB with AHSA1/START domain
MAGQVAEVEMLIRRPVAVVFDAFVRPEAITKFWLESTSGPLAPGAQVQWCFMVPGATETVTVTAFREQQHLAFDWSGGISVAIDFAPWDDGATRLAVKASGFTDEQVVNAAEGFAIVLCDLKTLLETGRSANLVKDKAELIARS